MVCKWITWPNNIYLCSKLIRNDKMGFILVYVYEKIKFIYNFNGYYSVTEPLTSKSTNFSYYIGRICKEYILMRCNLEQKSISHFTIDSLNEKNNKKCLWKDHKKCRWTDLVFNKHIVNDKFPLSLVLSCVYGYKEKFAQYSFNPNLGGYINRFYREAGSRT